MPKFVIMENVAYVESWLLRNCNVKIDISLEEFLSVAYIWLAAYPPADHKQYKKIHVI